MLNSELPIFSFSYIIFDLEAQIYKTRVIEKGHFAELPGKVINRIINIGLLHL